MPASCNVLLSSAGRRVALLHIWRQALRHLGLRGEVLATDMSPCSAAFHAADRAFRVPPCSSDDFVPRLLEICAAHDVRVIVPTIDTELPALAEARDDFTSIGTSVLVSSPSTVEIGYDKQRTHAWLTKNGLSTVEQAQVADLVTGGVSLAMPLIIKPRRGSSSAGVVRVDSLSELGADRDHDIAQTVAPGVEYTVDVLLNRSGKCISAVARRRLEVRAGEVSKGITVRDDRICGLAQQVAEALPGGYGVLNIQIFCEDAERIPRVIEFNARFGGGYPLSWQAGARFPCWLLEEILGMASTAHDHWEDGLTMLRYDEAVFVKRSEAGL